MDQLEQEREKAWEELSFWQDFSVWWLNKHGEPLDARVSEALNLAEERCRNGNKSWVL
jgi:hypothetical protein